MTTVNSPKPVLAVAARLGWRLEYRPIFEKNSDQPIDQDLYFRPALHCVLAIEDKYNQAVLDLNALLESVKKPGRYFLLNCECGLADDAGIMDEIVVRYPNAHFIVWEFEAQAYRSLLQQDSRFAKRDGRVRLIFTREQYEADLQRMVDEAKQANERLELSDIEPNDYRFTEYLLSGNADLPIRTEPSGEVVREPEEMTLEYLEDAICRWERSVSYLDTDFDCSDEYTHELFERECLNDVLNRFEAQSLAVPDALKARIDAADKRFVELTVEVEHSVWGARATTKRLSGITTAGRSSSGKISRISANFPAPRMKPLIVCLEMCMAKDPRTFLGLMWR